LEDLVDGSIPIMRQAGRLRSLLKPLSRVLLLALSLNAHALPAASAESFQRGWEAYDQGDYGQAIRLWLPLAEQGHVNAQINLGVMYDNGNGVPQDAARAARWYRAAARQDSVIAQYNLGMFLAERRIQSTGEEDALYWLRKAAAQGYADAQFQLGLMYAECIAGQARIEDAPQWLYQAGLNYLSHDDGDGAESAVSALLAVASGEKLARELKTRLANWSNPGGQAVAGTATSGLSTGTAWPVAAGYAVTNHHVVSGSQSVVLVDSRGGKIPATVVARDETHDVALLRVEQPDKLPPALPIAPGGAHLGASVFTIGFPRIDVMGTSPKLSLGIISSINGVQDDPSSYQISVPIQPGNSGGPLLNMRGEVVGIITSMLGRVDSANGGSQPLPNINYALKIDVIAEFLPPTAGPSTALNASTGGGNSLESLARRIQGSVLIVMAE
jgi:S1-C subfamily serine protease